MHWADRLRKGAESFQHLEPCPPHKPAKDGSKQRALLTHLDDLPGQATMFSE